MAETLNNKENKMTWPLDVSQPLSSATSVLTQWVHKEYVRWQSTGARVGPHKMSLPAKADLDNTTGKNSNLADKREVIILSEVIDPDAQKEQDCCEQGEYAWCSGGPLGCLLVLPCPILMASMNKYVNSGQRWAWHPKNQTPRIRIWVKPRAKQWDQQRCPLRVKGMNNGERRWNSASVSGLCGAAVVIAVSPPTPLPLLNFPWKTSLLGSWTRHSRIYVKKWIWAAQAVNSCQHHGWMPEFTFNAQLITPTLCQSLLPRKPNQRQSIHRDNSLSFLIVVI